jgi:hypothetical protein
VKSGLRVIVTGFIAQHHRLGGVAWDYIQYLVGLKRAGHDVFYLEDSGLWPYRFPGDEHDPSGAPNARGLDAVMRRFGFADRWAYRAGSDKVWRGLSDASRKEALRTCDLLINVSGSLTRPSDYRRVPKLVYIDSDPVFTQIQALQSVRMRKRLEAHDVHFSFGECLAAAPVPRTPFPWIPTRTPIAMEEWARPAVSRAVYTTVMSWTSYKPLVHEGKSYGQKDVEFRRFIGLPERVGVRLELATHTLRRRRWESGQRQDRRDPAEVLEAHGWTLADSLKTAGDLDSYRDYILSSRAEWSVAKNGYVEGRPGWFSCRSACYLAAGKPVVVQDTGFGAVIPAGEGVLAFRDPEEAADGIRRVESDYARHARAAREIAAEYFEARKVAAGLVEAAFAARAAAARAGGPP